MAVAWLLKTPQNTTKHHKNKALTLTLTLHKTLHTTHAEKNAKN
ncbi:hypothetical protein [Helicobacter pylori]|nr:hypothetical protein [Helicobacter pylori]